MVKALDVRERESEILNLVVEAYIKESKPVSSSHLCEKYKLPCSSATVRNVMEALEEKGFLSHLHTSSGRVPTKKGFKCYVERLNEADLVSDYATEANFSEMVERDGQGIVGALDILAQSSGYASFLAVSGKGNQLFFSGTRFILEQPEFEDISRLKNVFYALEVKMQKLQELLLNYFDERLKILIGDDIGFEEISDCSLVVCGSGEDKILFTLALLGPMRMDYIKAVTCLCSVKGQLKDIIGASL